VHGEVIASANDISVDNSVELRHRMTVEGGTWVAIRAYGADQSLAHSAPVYVTVSGTFENPASVPVVARRMLEKLDEFETARADVTEELEAWSVGERLDIMLTEQRIHILERAEAARAIYARMLDRYIN